MIVDIKAVVGYFRKGGDLSRARAVEEAYYIYADNMAKAKPETVCELEMPEVKPSHDRKLLEPDWLAREVSDLRREVDALKAERSEVGSTSHCDDCGGRIKAGGTCYCEGREWGRVDPQWVVVAGGTPGIVSSLRYYQPTEKPSAGADRRWERALEAAISRLADDASNPVSLARETTETIGTIAALTEVLRFVEADGDREPESDDEPARCCECKLWHKWRQVASYGTHGELGSMRACKSVGRSVWGMYQPPLSCPFRGPIKPSADEPESEGPDEKESESVCRDCRKWYSLPVVPADYNTIIKARRRFCPYRPNPEKRDATFGGVIVAPGDLACPCFNGRKQAESKA